MDNTQGHDAHMHSPEVREKTREHDKRIRELEIQVHALTAAVQHILVVTRPLMDIAEAAQAAAEAKELPAIQIIRG